MLRRSSSKEVRGAGFAVTVVDIHRVQYVAGDHVATVDIEGGADADGQVNWMVYGATLASWAAPYEMEDFAAETQATILARISTALTVLDMPHQVV